MPATAKSMKNQNATDGSRIPPMNALKARSAPYARAAIAAWRILVSDSAAERERGRSSSSSGIARR
jgi:hypothetical protein